MFSANPSISPIGLKPLDVAKGRENGRTGGNRVGLGRNTVNCKRNGVELEGGTGSDWGERGRTREEWDQIGGERDQIRGGTRSDWRWNGVGLGGNGVGLGGNGVGLRGNGVGLEGERGRTGGGMGLDWGERGRTGEEWSRTGRERGRTGEERGRTKEGTGLDWGGE